MQITSIPLYRYLATGNHKLPDTTAIFNLGSATDCPSKKLGFCQAIKDNKNICYAYKAENRWAHVLPYRRNQTKLWNKTSAKEFVSQFLDINKSKRKKYTALRLNEAGDFWDQNSLNKAEEIAKYLKNHNITVYCYTSRQDLDFSNISNLIVSGSNFEKNGISNVFKMIVDRSERPKGYGICAGNCRVCSRCLIKGKKTCVLAH